MYTSKVLKYEENGQLNVAFILDYQFTAEELKIFVFWKVYPGLIIPSQPIQAIEENIGSHDEYYASFYNISRLVITSKRTYEIHFPRLKFDGYINDRDMINLGFYDLGQLLVPKVNAYVLMTNQSYGKQYDLEKIAYRFGFRGRRG